MKAIRGRPARITGDVLLPRRRQRHRDVLSLWVLHYWGLRPEACSGQVMIAQDDENGGEKYLGALRSMTRRRLATFRTCTRARLEWAGWGAE